MKKWSPPILLLFLSIAFFHPASCSQRMVSSTIQITSPSHPELIFPASKQCRLRTRHIESCSSHFYATIIITYLLGTGTTIQENGAIRLVTAYPYNGKYRTEKIYTDNTRWPAVQNSDPAGANFITARVINNPFGTVKPAIQQLENGKLQIGFDGTVGPGATVEITYGDTAGGSPGYMIPPLAYDIPLVLEQDDDADGVFETLNGPFPILRTAGTNMESLQVIAPTTPLDRTFEIIVKAMEGRDESLSNMYIVPGYSGTVTFSSNDSDAILPEDYAFRPEDEGVKNFPVTLRATGARSVKATEVDSGISGTSNPILTVRPSRPTGKEYIFWGVLQQHTNIGGHAFQTPQFAYGYAKNVAGLDFLSLTEHCGKEHYDWSYNVQVADRFNEPGEFVTFSGYEWGHRDWGHRHVVYRDASAHQDEAYCERDNFGNPTVVVKSTLNKLLEALQGKNAIVIPHHTAWRYSIRERKATDDVILGPVENGEQRLFEIFSHNGSSEMPNNSPYVIHGHAKHQWRGGEVYFQDLLSRGYKFGVVAGTDDHFGMPGGHIGAELLENGYTYSRKGVTAVYAGERTRAGIWEALQARRTYGTTGARIVLDFSIAGHPMGEEIEVPNPLRIRIGVNGTDILESVEIIRDGNETIHSIRPMATTVNFSFVDDQIVAGREYSYYIRVVQADGHMAWSSPIWVTIL